MDAKKRITEYIGKKKTALIIGLVSLVLGVALIAMGVPVAPLLLGVAFYALLIGIFQELIPGSRTKKALEELESRGLLQRAAAEISSANKRIIGKNRAYLTENFLFCKGTGLVYYLPEVAWAYKYKFTQRMFFIPVYTTESLMLGDGKGNPVQAINLGGKDKNDELKAVILHIYQRNPKMLVGYNADTKKAYAQLRKQR